MPIMEGWEISPDRIKMYEEMMENDFIGDPIITSKCVLDTIDTLEQKGTLIASTNGYAYRSKKSVGRIIGGGIIGGAVTAARSAAVKRKWFRWHDVFNIVPKKNGRVHLVMKRRLNGELVLTKKGKYKVRMYKLWITRNKDETKTHFKQRKQDFPKIMIDIWNRYKGEEDPPISDSFG